jgi:DNA-binding response OmpR family regulator
MPAVTRSTQNQNTPQTSTPSLMLLDVMLPRRYGMAICRERRQFSALPVIFLTARIDAIDRLLGSISERVITSASHSVHARSLSA